MIVTTETTEQERRESVDRMLGSWVLDGFEPNANYLALYNRYISGELTIEQVLSMITMDFVAANKIDHKA